MNDDELRTRLARLDPMAGRSVPALTDEDKERIMTLSTGTPDAPHGSGSTDRPAAPRRRALLAAAAAVVLVGGGTAAYLAGGDAAPRVKAPTTLALTQGPTDALASCLPLSAELLRGAAHAFEGRVVSAADGVVTFDVARWYQGGSQDLVTLTNQSGPDSVAQDGTRFEVGTTYLVAASDEGVGPCSGTGESSPELTTLFDEAFPKAG